MPAGCTDPISKASESFGSFSIKSASGSEDADEKLKQDNNYLKVPTMAQQ